jgi:hypothetical protein
MAAAPQTNQAGAQAALDALLALVNVGGAGKIKVFTGSPPANLETADSGTLLATLTFSATAFPASATNASPRGAKATASAITAETNAPASGTAGYFRCYPNTPTTINGVLQGTCGTSAADMIMNTTAITIGQTVSCSSFTVTQPDGA